MKNEWRALAAVGVLVIGVYAYAAYSGFMALPDQQAANACYNRLVEGFQVGQLNLKAEVPAGLTYLSDPYNPTANAPYRTAKYGLNDVSYYKGKVYLYFGVTPALLVFWPFVGLTGHYLYDAQAVVIFCALGFLASVGILCALRRRYFPDVSIWVVAAGALALGLATGVPTMLPRSNVNEVAISCGYMLTMLALWAIWRALHETERQCRWLSVASVAYGLAVGARPSLLFGGVILLVPVAQAWRGRRPVWPPLLAATVPIALIGLGLMLYNARRFGSPFEFGMQYQLTPYPLLGQQFFHLRYLWFNFRVYFLEPLQWGAHFPFVRKSIVPALPAGYARVENPYGILTSVPLVWLALAVPLAWRERPGQAASILRWFGMVVALLFGICALTIGLYNNAIGRYEVDFLPALLLLAVGGILGLDRALADRSCWRCRARWGWVLLLGFSVAVNLLASVERYGDVCDADGVSMQALGKTPEAISLFQEALRIEPDDADAHNHLGASLMGQGRLPEAIDHFEQALRIEPRHAAAHNSLAIALFGLGKVPEAIGHFEQAVLLRPNYTEAQYNLGLALMEQGRLPEAIDHFEQAVRLRPNYAEAQYNLGVALMEQGKLPEAIGHFEQAVRLKPDDVEAQSDLGAALEKMGRIDDAIAHYEEALKLRPDLAAARNALARLRAGP